MRRYLLDTGPLTALFFNRPAIVAAVTPWLQREEVATSILVYGEVIEYLAGRPDFAQRQAELRTLFAGVYPFFLTYSILSATLRYGATSDGEVLA